MLALLLWQAQTEPHPLTSLGRAVHRTIPALAAVLLTAACASTTAPAGSPSATTAAATPSSAGSAPAGPTPTATTTAVAVPAGKLPYKPAAGMPALGDVSIVSTAADPCAVPADDSGNEAQLIDAQLDGNVVIVTFEFTNPCKTPLRYDFTVTPAIGSKTGPSGGAPGTATTPPIPAGGSISFHLNVDPVPR